MRLFKSQKTRGDRANLFYEFEFIKPKLTKKTPIPILASD